MASAMMYEMVNAILCSVDQNSQSDDTLTEFVKLCADGIRLGQIILLDADDTLRHFYYKKSASSIWVDLDYVQSMLSTLKGDERMPFPMTLIVFRVWTNGEHQTHALFVSESESGERFFGKYVFALFQGKLACVPRDKHAKYWPGSIKDDVGLVDLLASVIRAINACTNATWPEVPTPRSVRRRHNAFAAVRFRTVSIETRKKRGGRTFENNEATGTAWHRRRGHIAVYTADNPLKTPTGGTFVGRVWRNAVEVGDKKHGIIVQDYTVKAPDA
jgi:hypothetical protein